MKRWIATAALALTAALTPAACGGGPQQPAVDAAAVLRQGGAAMGQLRTVTATLKFTKGSITFRGFALVSARTSVQLPADSDTDYTVREQDFTISLKVVISGGHVYLRVPFSTLREVTGADATALPDLARMFNPSTGLPALIPAGSKPAYVSTDQVDGHSADQIATTYSPAQVQALLAQLSSSGPVAARIWVDVSDHYIRKAVLDGAFGDGGKEASVEVDITGFNGPVTISSPVP